MLKQLLAWKAQARANRIAAFLVPHLQAGEKVLDFGAGTMQIASRVAKLANVKVVGVDVLPDNETDLEFHIYDGQHLPFADKSFDALYAISVLHHTDDAESVIRECLRVTKHRLLIHEDIYANWLELQLVKAWDYIFNKILYPDMYMPFNFRKTKEWEKLFKSFPEVKSVQSIPVTPDPLRPTRHRLFVIELK